MVKKQTKRCTQFSSAKELCHKARVLSESCVATKWLGSKRFLLCLSEGEKDAALHLGDCYDADTTSAKRQHDDSL